MRIFRWILVPAVALLAACGDGPPTSSGTPPEPEPEETGATVSLAAGATHTCMADTLRTVWCWGSSAQLTLPPPDRPLPTQVRVLPRPVAQVSAGIYGTCALETGGPIHCWGWPGPTGMPDGLLFSSLWSGGIGYCGLTSAGKAYCWGTSPLNERISGEVLGQPAGLAFTVMAPGGGHVCGLSAEGKVYCWGQGTWGERGDGTNTLFAGLAPVLAPAGVTFKALDSASSATCAVSTTGQVYCWGENTSSPLLGDGTRTSRNVPGPVQRPAGVSFATIAMSYAHACATTTEGDAYCWGTGEEGQLGDGAAVSRLVPTRVQLPAGVKLASLALGTYHSCGIARTSGRVYCWGDNQYGQLGDGTTTDRATPVAVVGP